MTEQIAQRQDQASFLTGELTAQFLGEAGVESVGANGGDAAGFPTITGVCCRVSWRICPTPRLKCTITPNCTIFC